jgi:hypothetical protein
VLDFRFKERMAEAQAYVTQLQEINDKLDEINAEVI